MPHDARGFANGVQRAPGSILGMPRAGSQQPRRTKFSDFVTSQDDAWTMEETTPPQQHQRSVSTPPQIRNIPGGPGDGPGRKADNPPLPQDDPPREAATSVPVTRPPLVGSPTPIQASSSSAHGSALSMEERVLANKFTKLLAEPRLSLDKLRDLSWHGIPRALRPRVWRLLSGYIPPVAPDKRTEYLKRKRREYQGLVSQYYGSRLDEKNKGLFHQIVIDVPRTNPSLSQFQKKECQEVFERILYIWALRHPGSSYVQGMNDLVTPLFNTFLEDSITCTVSKLDFTTVDQEVLRNSEADSFWCLSKVLDGVQDNYTMAQKGIQRKVMALADLVARIDKPLYEHLEAQNIPFMHFSFRWMNCLLMRELPLACAVRMFDTYLAEVDGFAIFHLYVCAAFLKFWSKQICCTHDFTDLLTLLQNLPTSDWTDKDIGMVLSEAFVWKHKFHGLRNAF